MRTCKSRNATRCGLGCSDTSSWKGNPSNGPIRSCSTSGYETEGLKALIEILRNDERKHHKALQDMAKKRYFKVGRYNMDVVFQDTEWLEERYRRLKRFREKLDQGTPVASST